MKKTCREYEYCIGCGLCESVFGKEKATLKLDPDGFYRPLLHLDSAERRKLETFCPIDVGVQRYSDNIWGVFKQVMTGYSSNEEVRRRASSGGVLSSIADYLLAKQLVDGILQIGDGEDPLRPELHISKSAEDVVSCSGSKYIAVLPWNQLLDLLKTNKGKKYALIGRPCDIRGIRALQNEYSEVKEQIVYLLSFFCAGTPSVEATKKMVASMGVKTEDVEHIQYRGDGWPGFSTVRTKEKQIYKMTYEESWGKILGRDIYRGCRFCYDGIGEAADISCGDAWYLNENGKISFEERPGRNVIFARTDEGVNLLDKVIEAGFLVTQKYDIEQLAYIQPFQYMRKAQLRYKLLAMRIAGRQIPEVKTEELKKYVYVLPRKERLRMYIGTIRRILKKKI